MPKGISDAKHRSIVREAIAEAEKSAGKDTRAFVEALRDHALGKIGTRTGGGARSLDLPVGELPPRRARGPRLDDDARYLANVRALATRTKRNARILGGSDVAGKEFEDCVAVGSDIQFACTGTLIAPNVVLTAGHCEEFHTRIFVGNDTERRGRVFRVARHVRHPKWNDDLENDLMLLILEKPVTRVAPRALATGKVIDAATDARVVGFGTTDTEGRTGYGTKRQTDVPIVSPSCRGRVNGQSDRVVYGCHTGKEIVAGKPLLLHDTCKGDSGGPIYVADARGRWLLAGVTSRGTEHTNTLCGDGGVYTRVDKFRTWIASVLK